MLGNDCIEVEALELELLAAMELLEAATAELELLTATELLEALTLELELLAAMELLEAATTELELLMATELLAATELVAELLEIAAVGLNTMVVMLWAGRERLEAVLAIVRRELIAPATEDCHASNTCV